MLLNVWAIGDVIAAVAIGVGIMASLIWLIFQTGILVNKIESMSDSVNKIPSIEFKIESMSNRISSIEFKVELMSDSVNKIPGIDFKVEELWRQKITQSNSPMFLNDVGKKILENSKIDELTDKYYADIINKVRAQSPQNPFQAQELLIRVVADYQNKEECTWKLQEAAYDSGYDVKTVLFVAAINIRDSIIDDLGFNHDDIDKHDPEKNPPV